MSDGICEIETLKWGRMEVSSPAGRLVFKDCKIRPGHATAWDWGTTGTRHRPGIQVADIEEVLAAGVSVLVLSRGMELKLGTCPETLAHAADRGIVVHQLETSDAAGLFNDLSRQGKRVGGLFHSTC